jgi:hypothetical protein
MATWGIWLFVIGRRTLTSDIGENGVKTLVCVKVTAVILLTAEFYLILSVPFYDEGIEQIDHLHGTKSFYGGI